MHKPNETSAASINQQVGHRLRLARTVKGLTMEQVGRLIGVSYQQIQTYETSSNVISPQRLIAIAQALGRNVAYFFDAPEMEKEFGDRHAALQRLLRNLLKMERSHPKRFKAVCAMVNAVPGDPEAYVQVLAEAMHAELKPAGVDVLASAPGPVHRALPTAPTCAWETLSCPKPWQRKRSRSWGIRRQ